MPSINASGRETVNAAKKLAERLDMTPAEYRKTMSALRTEIKLIENNLREKDYSFDYSKQPAKAMFKYRAALLRNDAERYQAFPDNLNRREAALHTGTLMPYELVDPYLELELWSQLYERYLRTDMLQLQHNTKNPRRRYAAVRVLC